jgi:hypothetical protein
LDVLQANCEREAGAAGRAVPVHRSMGHARSPAVVLAWMVIHRGLDAAWLPYAEAQLAQQRGDTLKALTTLGDVRRELAAEQAATQ